MPKLARSLDTCRLGELRWAVDRCRNRAHSSERRIHAVYAHHAEKRTLAELAQKYGVSKRAVSKWVAAFRNGGVSALKSRPRIGISPGLDAAKQEALLTYLDAHRKGTESETREWLEQQLKRKVSRSFARYWRDVTLTKLGVPRRKRSIWRRRG